MPTQTELAISWKFPKYCCIKCKYTPNIQPEDFHRFIGTAIHCRIMDIEVYPDHICPYFTLPSNKEKTS